MPSAIMPVRSQIRQTLRGCDGSRETIVVSTDSDEVAVVNTDYGGHLLEWGARTTAAHAPLRSAVRAAGLHFREAA